MRAKPVSPDKVELEGPYECACCGFHMMVDATYLDQVGLVLTCPSCATKLYFPSEDELEKPEEES